MTRGMTGVHRHAPGGHPESMRPRKRHVAGIRDAGVLGDYSPGTPTDPYSPRRFIASIVANPPLLDKAWSDLAQRRERWNSRFLEIHLSYFLPCSFRARKPLAQQVA